MESMTKVWGEVDNQPVYLYTLRSGSLTAVISNFGATVVSLNVPDQTGKVVDVVLGYDTLEEYERNNRAYFGGTIGRCANRISNSQFTLDGSVYHLTANEWPNSLHSGLSGFHMRVWETVSFTNENELTLRLESPAMDQGFPGNLEITASFKVTDNGMTITYSGTSDATTIFNPTNHSYFNLNGHKAGSVVEHLLRLQANYYTPVENARSLTTGEICNVLYTPMDFTRPKTIGSEMTPSFRQLLYTDGYDHNFCITKYNGDVMEAAQLTGDQTGIRLTLKTNEPGLHLYTGNYLTDDIGKGGAHYYKHAGVSLQPQFYPDAINHPNYISPILHKGETKTFETQYLFDCVS